MAAIKATINGVELTEQQLEDGLAQIKKLKAAAARFIPRQGDFFTYGYGVNPTANAAVYLAIKLSPNSAYKAPDNCKLLAVSKNGEPLWFADPDQYVFKKMSGFNN